MKERKARACQILGRFNLHIMMAKTSRKKKHSGGRNLRAAWRSNFFSRNRARSTRQQLAACATSWSVRPSSIKKKRVASFRILLFLNLMEKWIFFFFCYFISPGRKPRVRRIFLYRVVSILFLVVSVFSIHVQIAPAIARCDRWVWLLCLIYISPELFISSLSICSGASAGRDFGRIYCCRSVVVSFFFPSRGGSFAVPPPPLGRPVRRRFEERNRGNDVTSWLAGPPKQLVPY